MEQKNKYDRAIEAIDNLIEALKPIGMCDSAVEKQTEEFKEVVRFKEFLEVKYGAGNTHG